MQALNLHTLLRASAALLLLAWLAWLSRGSWQQLQSLETAANIAPPAQTTAPLETPDPLAIAQLFGVMPQAADTSIAEVPLNLLASLQESTAEQSRALIASPDGSRFYRIGETLPGGAVLRQIDATHVLIQRLGNELSLPLNTSTSSLLTPVTSADELSADAITGRLVQPSP